MDFDHLPEEKQRIYRQIQATHIHGSPDGPWFFIIARTDTRNKQFQLIGITDTAMLRPQVFALQDGQVEIGLICSEKQAIDATLESLAKEDPRFGTVADRYWNARGGSYTDGGSFIFTVKETEPGHMSITCADKFGRAIDVPADQTPLDFRSGLPHVPTSHVDDLKNIVRDLSGKNVDKLFEELKPGFAKWSYARFHTFLTLLTALAEEDDLKGPVIKMLALLLDRHYSTGDKRRRSILQMVSTTLDSAFRSIPMLNDSRTVMYGRRIDFDDPHHAPRTRRRRKGPRCRRDRIPAGGRRVSLPALSRMHTASAGNGLSVSASAASASWAAGLALTRKASGSMPTVPPATILPRA